MRVPYLKIEQKEEVFFLTKFNSEFLKDKVNFHFRQPYSDESLITENYNDYIQKIQKKGLEISAEDEGIQRRLQLPRIEKIKKYLEEQVDSFFPNTVILSVDLSKYDDFMKDYLDKENDEVGYFDFPDDVQFQIVDGQHRLAGLFISNEDIQKNFDIPVVLLINITINTCAKIFADVNGNQAPVNKSIIYDLYELMNDDETKKINKALHSICKQFNTDRKSPLYQHIKMLGIGNGAISQSFFANALKKAFKELNYNYENLQYMYTALFYYFSAFQRIFPKYWPVLENTFIDYSHLKEYSEKVLKVEKSQLLKTNGFGSIMYLFPLIFKKVKTPDYQLYYNEIIKLREINWCTDEILTSGTGEKTQKEMYRKLKRIIESDKTIFDFIDS